MTGSVVCRGDIAIGRGCRIGGPLISETTLTIAGGTSIGSADHPTTVSAWAIAVEPGVEAFGTVWAHAAGMVRPQTANAAARGAAA